MPVLPCGRVATSPCQTDFRVDPRPIDRGSGPCAVLLLHGLTGTPYEVRPIADHLFERGLAVRAPLLAGHGDLEALERSTWRDWYRSAEQALDDMYARGAQRVAIVGFSLGGLLAIRLAALHDTRVHALIAISVPLELPPWKRTAVGVLAKLRGKPLVGGLVGMLPKEGPDVRIRREFQDSPSLQGFPYPTLAELVALQAEVMEILPRVHAPTLLLHGRFDHAVPVEHSERLAQRIGSAIVRRVVLPRSFHIVGRDLDRDRVCQEVHRFTAEMLAPSSPHSTEPSVP